MENLESCLNGEGRGQGMVEFAVFYLGRGRSGVNCGNPLFEVVELTSTRLLDYFNQ